MQAAAAAGAVTPNDLPASTLGCDGCYAGAVSVLVPACMPASGVDCPSGRCLQGKPRLAGCTQCTHLCPSHSRLRLPTLPPSLPALPPPSGLMSGYLSLFEAAGRLNTLQDEEFTAMLQLLARMGTVFSPLQKARVAAASSPYFPDSVRACFYSVVQYMLA